MIKRHKKSESKYTLLLGLQQGDTHLNSGEPSSRIREDLHVQGQGEDHQPGLDSHHSLCHHQPSLHGPRVFQTRNHLQLLVIYRHVPHEKCQISNIILSRCPKSWCAIFEAFIGVSIVSNSCLNPYIFLFFNSDNRQATNITTNCCLKGSSEER